MEKLLYLLWKDPAQTAEALKAAVSEAATALTQAGAHGVQLNLVDGDVESFKFSINNSGLYPDAVLSLWVDSAVHHKPYTAIARELSSRAAGYLVRSSEPIANTRHVVSEGERTPGFAQVVFLTRPDWLTRESWLHHWHQGHTPVAIETQSTFRYVQNVVIQALTFAAPQIDAIIEEAFPAEALSSMHVFYDAVGDDEKLQRNAQAMAESCARFIDMERIDCMATSEYILKKA
jgi:hypothetical protein